MVCQRGRKLSRGVAAWLSLGGISAGTLEGGFEAWPDGAGMLFSEATLPPRDAAGRTVGVTRARPKADRIACPWLIRRFIDPDAAFLIVGASEVEGVAAAFGAAFDIDGAFRNHRGEGCTLDTVIEELGLRSPVLDRLVVIVRAAGTAHLDLSLQAAGLLAASLNLFRMYRDDLQQLEASMALYDSFYRWCRDPEYRKSLLSDLAKAQVAASEHGQEAVKAARRRTYQTLTAPGDGTVQQLAVHTIGGVVTPAQQLLAIVPKNSRLEIEANLANRDVGFVQAGQAVEVKVEAFTFTRYGLLHGSVDSVSQDAVVSEARLDRAREADAPADETERQARQPAYVAHISVQESGIETEQGFRTIEPGMAVTAEIKTGQRRIIEYLLSPLVRYRHDAGRER